MIDKVKNEMMRLLGSKLSKTAKTLPFDGKFFRTDFCFSVGRKFNVNEIFLLKNYGNYVNFNRQKLSIEKMEMVD